MTVESATYISDLNTANPAAGDPKSEGDDHIRLLKSTVKATFSGLAAAATPGSMGTSLGLVGTPAYSFTGDADTGMWSPTANTVAVSTGGAEAVRVDSSQNVGVGVSPLAKFDVLGTVNVRDSRNLGTAVGAIFYGGDAGTIPWIGSNAASAFGLFTNSAERLRITVDGRFYGTALHNNAGAVTGTATQYIASGTYTPTLTNVTNVAASTARVCQWIRVGNVVTVSGGVDIDTTTAGGTATELGLSLPIASSITLPEQLGGTACSSRTVAGASISAQIGNIQGDAPNDRAQLITNSSDAQNNYWSFSFQYVVL
jgi:hypothetical protein